MLETEIFNSNNDTGSLPGNPHGLTAESFEAPIRYFPRYLSNYSVGPTDFVVSNCQVINTSAEPVDVIFAWYDEEGNSYSKDKTIEGYGFYNTEDVFSQITESNIDTIEPPEPLEGVNFSLVVESESEALLINMSTNVYSKVVDTFGEVLASSSYDGTSASSVSQLLYFPLYLYNHSIGADCIAASNCQVMNTSDVPIDVVFTWYDQDGETYSHTEIIESYRFYNTNDDFLPTSGTNFALVVTAAGGEITGIVQTDIYDGLEVVATSSYDGISAPYLQLYFPRYLFNHPTGVDGVASSQAQIFNPGVHGGNITLTWYDENGNSYTKSEFLGSFSLYNTEADFSGGVPSPLTGTNFALSVSSTDIPLAGCALTHKFEITIDTTLMMDKIKIAESKFNLNLIGAGESVYKAVASSAYNGGGCDADGEFRPPVAVITTDPDSPSGPASLIVTFNGTSSHDQDEEGLEIINYQWDFADGGSSTESIVQYTYNEAGVYSVTLTVTDDENQTDSETIAIEVDPPSLATLNVRAKGVTAGSSKRAKMKVY
jgi:hypothetical protein